MQSRVLAITPAKNESKNIIDLCKNLSETNLPERFTWIIVVNGSTDDTLEVAQNLKSHFQIIPFGLDLQSNLSRGGAWIAWHRGIQYAEKEIEFNFAMKLDADVRLAEDYFQRLDERLTNDTGIIGGITLDRKNREQLNMIQGAVKMYSRQALSILESLPKEIGFDCLDEIELERSGLKVCVVQGARYSLARVTGSSEGYLYGRFRNGKACRNVGYYFPYFVLHCLRNSIRRPPILGSLAIFVGYFFGSTNLFSSEVRLAHKNWQKSKLRSLIRHPISWFRRNYFISSNL